jgi:RNA polymerase sigma factor (sigma-70 family)
MSTRPSLELSRKLALMSERELVGLSAAGDRDAYGELVRRHARFVRDLLIRMGAAHALADDLAQDVFIDALKSLPTYRLEAPFPAWLRTIAARHFMRRRHKDAREILLASPIGDDVPDETPANGPQRLDLDAALRELSQAERLCVVLCHGAGLSHDEISGALDVPLGTVKSHVTRGLKKLRRQLIVDKPPPKGGPHNV